MKARKPQPTTQTQPPRTDLQPPRWGPTPIDEHLGRFHVALDDDPLPDQPPDHTSWDHDGDRLAFKLHGAHRTGTTVTNRLLKQNFHTKARSAEHGRWVHAPCWEPNPRRLHILTLRNPWSWALSWHRFTRPPILGPVRDALLGRNLEPHAAMQGLNYYTHAVQNWLRHLPGHAIVRLEDIHHNQEAVVNWFADGPLPKRTDEVVTATDHLAPYRGLGRILPQLGDGVAALWQRLKGGFDSTYYTDERYLDDIQPETKDRLLRWLDQRGFLPFFNRLGYDMEDALR